MKQGTIFKLIVMSSFLSLDILPDEFGDNVFNRAKESAKYVIASIQRCRRKIKDSVRSKINECFVKEENEDVLLRRIEFNRKEPKEITEIRNMIAKLEHERLHPTCPPILHALRWYGSDDSYHKDFYRLLNDPNTDVNIMDDERSLLHFVWHRHDKEYGLEMLRAILARPDLKVDQKGNGSGDNGETVLGIAVRFTIWLKTFPYIKDHTEQKKIDSCIAAIELLLEKGANPELMSEETKRKFFQYCKTDDFQDLAVKIKNIEIIEN